MSSAFFGLNIGASALRTAQTQVDVTNQNIANANTPGYSRQIATVTATTPMPTPAMNAGGTAGQLGTGVQVAQINRARNVFVDTQMHTQLALQGQVNTKRDALAQVEATVNEPSTTGLGATVTKYWAAWQEVANTPADSAVRANLVESGRAVADVFQSTVTQFKAQQGDIDSQVSLGVTSVNTYASQIAALNTKISQVESSGMKANDLRDQRDLVVDQLSSMVKVSVVEASNGSININVGNHQLVDRDNVHPMQATVTNGSPQVQWSAATTAVSTGSVALGGAGLSAPGSLVINGQSVGPLSAGASSAAVMAVINGTSALQGPNGVTASLVPSVGGKLVLTANAAGAGGTVAIGGASTASVLTDLGLTSGTTAGIDAVSVNLGGGTLQGLMDSHDLLQERIDDVNTLATRIITSVNAVQVSGVGLDGKGGINFFSGTDATNMALDSNLTGPGGTDHVAAARMTIDSNGDYSSAGGDSSNAVALAQIQSAIARPVAGGTGLAPGQPIGTSGAQLLGVDLSGAAANTKYSFSMHGSPAALSISSDGVNFKTATVTAGTDGATPQNQIVTVDAGTVRLTYSLAPTTPATSSATAVAAISAELSTSGSVTTQSAPATIGEQYAQQIASLGVESATAQSQSANQEILVNNLDTQRQQTSGVSLDEETVNLMMYQKAYQAAARVITTLDGMLDTLINHTGL